jgi:putative membrane protein
MSAHDEHPRVIVEDAPRANEPPPSGPSVFAGEASGPVVPVQRPVPKKTASAPHRRDSWVRAGLSGVAIGLAGWLCLDSYWWVADAFARGAGFGALAASVIVLGFGGAALIGLRELKSFLALRRVEHDQHTLEYAHDRAASAEMREAIRRVIASIPKDRESEAAIEVYQRQAQAHHTPAQQVELLSRTVMRPLDRRAEAMVRRATARAFALTAIAPTALIDTVLFAALSVHMLRGIAACYGHRPTAAATAHLIRRLFVEAGKMGAVGLAGMAVTQHLSGALAERIAADAAQSVYAGQRMARIGLIAMGLCRPVPFQVEETPGILSSLFGSIFARAQEGGN